MKIFLYYDNNNKTNYYHNNNTKYEYDEVPLQVYTKFRIAESQGKFFTTDIAKKYKYKKV